MLSLDIFWLLLKTSYQSKATEQKYIKNVIFLNLIILFIFIFLTISPDSDFYSLGCVIIFTVSRYPIIYIIFKRNYRIFNNFIILLLKYNKYINESRRQKDHLCVFISKIEIQLFEGIFKHFFYKREIYVYPCQIVFLVTLIPSKGLSFLLFITMHSCYYTNNK